MLKKTIFWETTLDKAFDVVKRIIERNYPFDLCNGEYDFETVMHPRFGKLYKVTCYEEMEEEV